jgi:hypothetical protein
MTDTVLRRTSETLGLAGVGIAGYLTYVHYAGLHPICGFGFSAVAGNLRAGNLRRPDQLGHAGASS